MSILKQKEKLTSVYAVSLTSDAENDQVEPLTIVATTDNALEYIDALLKIEHRDHFNSWCDLRGLEQNEDSWHEYTKVVISDDELEQFSILELKYTTQEIARMMRIYNSYLPVGASYENNVEHEYFNNVLKNARAFKETLNKLKNSEEGKNDELVRESD